MSQLGEKVGDAYVYGDLWNYRDQFPIALLDTREKIYGELWELNNINEGFGTLDRIEGFLGGLHPQNLYERDIVKVFLANSSDMCYIYHMPLYRICELGATRLDLHKWTVSKVG